MIRPGLVSITFRDLSPRHIIDLAVQAAIEGIEWGGDVHVPHSHPALAKELSTMTRNAGLVAAAYGSYYRVGSEPADLFSRIVETALAIETKIIRVWAGGMGSDKADSAARRQVNDDAIRISELAAAAGLKIACEWHGGTLTDTSESAEMLFADVDHPAFCSYWQPRRLMPVAECLVDMSSAKSHLIGLHVFQWDLITGARQTLAEGAIAWAQYLAAAATSLPDRSFALLEFVKDDDPRQFVSDAQTLRNWLAAESLSHPA